MKVVHLLNLQSQLKTVIKKKMLKMLRKVNPKTKRKKKKQLKIKTLRKKQLRN